MAILHWKQGLLCDKRTFRPCTSLRSLQSNCLKISTSYLPQEGKILASSKLKEYADDNFNVAHMVQNFFNKVGKKKKK